METHIIELTCDKIDNHFGYVYTYHWLRYNMHRGRYETLRILWAAYCLWHSKPEPYRRTWE